MTKNATSTEKANKYCCRCDMVLDPLRSGHYCLPCARKVDAEWRNSLTLQPTREFPGVDIDAIYQKICVFVDDRGLKCRRLAGHDGACIV